MKKYNYKPQLINQNESYKASTIIIIILIITLLFIGFYFLTKYIIANKSSDEVVGEAVIQRDKIIFGQLLDRSEDEYYVLAYDPSIKFKEIYDKYVSKYESKDKSIKFYEIDLSDGFNKSFVTDELNIVDNISALTVNDEVLFKIKENKVDSYYVGYKDISEKLEKISK